MIPPLGPSRTYPWDVSSTARLQARRFASSQRRYVRAAAVLLLLSFGDVAGAAIFSVNSATDAGDLIPGDGSCATGAFVVINMFFVPECTFRAAIEEGNGLTGADTLDFTLAPLQGSALLLQPSTGYPNVTDTLDIDGTTIGGYDVGNIDATPLILVDGGGLSGLEDGLTFASTADESAVRALAIFDFPRDGLVISANDAVVEGCHIGVAIAILVLGNVGDGIKVVGDRIRIGQLCAPLVGCTGSRNTIAGSGDNGIETFTQSAHTVIAGNRIGTTPDGTAIDTGIDPTSNGGDGIENRGFQTQIGALGTLAQPLPDPPLPVASGNVIAGNATGIRLTGDGAIVVGNRIGSDVTGTIALGGQFRGIEIEGDANVIGAPGLGANVISGNGFDGVLVGAQGVESSSFNAIEGNQIGVDATGTSALGNSGYGVIVFNGAFNAIEGNHIGGNTLGGVGVLAPGNSVVDNYVGSNAAGTDLANGGSGIVTSQAGSLITGNTVGFNVAFGISASGDSVIQGNYVGTDALDRVLPNGVGGVRLSGDADLTFGGAADTPDAAIPGLANTVAYNTGAGIEVPNAETLASIRGNSVYANTGLGIDLQGNVGSNPNDPGDGDIGPNRLQNYPVFDPGQTLFDRGTGQLTTRYLVDSVVGANAVYPLTVDFYVEDGTGQGMHWIGSDVYDAGEAQTFVDIGFTPQAAVGVSDAIVATATAASGPGATSEFSAPIVVPEPGARLSLLLGAAWIGVVGRKRARR